MAVTQATELADFSSGIGTAGAILEVDNTNNRIGIGTTNPQALLQVGQIIKMDGATGIITATTFSGTSSLASNLTGTPDITVNNIVAAAATFSGVLTYEDVTNIDSIGIITARSDISIADKIIHTGDTNTAIRFPSADTFTVETSGVERLRVDSTGDLGLVGIATATGLVVVAGSGVYAGHTGVITATAFVGDGSNLTGVISGVELLQGGSSVGTGVTSINFSGATVSAPDSVGLSTVTVTSVPTAITVADESSDTTCFPLFVTAATGDLGPKSGTNLTFNSSSGALTATSFVGAVTGDVTGNATGLSGTPNISCGTGAFSGNVTLQANLDLQDDDKILLGTGDDLEIYHDGTSSYLTNGTGSFFVGGSRVKLTNAAVTEVYVDCLENGRVDLMYDASVKLTTKSDGVDITGELQCDSLDVDGVADITGNVTLHANLDLQDSDKILLGAGDDLQIYHDGSNSYIDDTATGSLHIRGSQVHIDKYTGETCAKFIADGAVELYHDNSKKFDTKSDGIDVTGEVQCDSLDVDGVADITGNVTLHANLDLQDSDKILLGTGDDLEIYHDGSNSIVSHVGTGDLYIQNTTNDKDVLIQTDDSSGGTTNYIQCDGSSGAVILTHYGTTKFTTTSTGITVTGNILPEANGTRDLGAAGTRWANLYTSDLDLSNEAKGGNDVDGTWGAYTIQEGENDLFLLNKRNGKTYKFVLQEVN